MSAVGLLITTGLTTPWRRTSRARSIFIARSATIRSSLFIDPAIKFPAARVASFLLKKKLGLRGLLSVIPLDAKLVRGSHGRMPERTEDRPILMVEEELEGFAPELPATAVYGIIKRLCLTD